MTVQTLIIIIYTFAICLNSVLKISAWAALDTNWHNSLAAAEVRRSAAAAFTNDEDDDDYETWQPAVQSQNWLITTAATAPLSLKSKQHRERESFSVMIERQEPHQQYRPNRYYVYNHHNGNYTKKQMTPLSAASYSPVTPNTASVTDNTLASASVSVSDQDAARATIKLKPYVVTSKDSANTITNANANDNYRRYNPMPHLHLIEQHPNTAHISKDTLSTATHAERRMDASKHFKTDVNRPSQHPYQDKLMTPAMIDSRLSHIPATAATTTADTFTVTNANLIDAAATTSNNADDENINAILLPLHAALDKVKQFCDIVKDIITDDKDNEDSAGDGGDVSDDTKDDAAPGAAAADEDLSNEEGNDDNDLTNLNFAPVLAAVKVLLMKQPKTSSSYSLPTPMDEVQGHLREIDEGMLEESLAASMRSTPTPTAPPSTASLPPPPAAPSVSASHPQPASSNPITSRSYTAHKTSSRAAPAESPRLRRVSKRKIKKKIKRKFKKYLFPLLVAYKLKFLALVPLLIGGLTLLVGSTGLAGFFFALFAAVMTMKSGHGHRRSLFV